MRILANNALETVDDGSVQISILPTKAIISALGFV
jgi:hypothetical protein